MSTKIIDTKLLNYCLFRNLIYGLHEKISAPCRKLTVRKEECLFTRAGCQNFVRTIVDTLAFGVNFIHKNEIGNLFLLISGFNVKYFFHSDKNLLMSVNLKLRKNYAFGSLNK